MSTTTCRCDAPHAEQVELSPIHIMGPGTFWRAAKPGRTYLVGHGFHFYTEDDAREYAFGPAPEQELADELHDHRDGATCHTCSTYNRD